MNDNGVICAAPWAHLYVNPNGNVHPCCTTWSVNYGNINQDSLETVWNSETANKFRQALLDGVKQECCEFCYNQENMTGSSLRTWLNDDYGHLINSDSAPLTNIAYIDIRSSNICNFACVMCNRHLSSKWHDLNTELGYEFDEPKFINLNDDAKQSVIDIMKHNVENIYFAGGEPLITPFHYEMLEYLIDAGYSKNISLRYNTNLSTVKYKNKSVFDLWKQFKKVNISASIDMPGIRGEFQRNGSDWKQIVDNWNNIRETMPSIEVVPQITITALSIGYIPELIQSLETELNYNTDLPYSINLSSKPEEWCSQNLPYHVKEQYTQKLLAFLDTCDKKEVYSMLINSCIKFMNDQEPDVDKFNQMKDSLDAIGRVIKKDWRMLWPEISNTIHVEK